jgi:chromate reductase, NAD(P)H dehydrogenase (quinone)
MQILGICGSLRKASLNMAALRACSELMPQGMTLRITRIDDLPLFNQDVFDAGIPEPAKRLRAEIAEADGVLIASPEYNFSVTAALKNAIDWASRPKGENALWGKPAAVVGASTGMFGAVWSQAELRKALSRAGARVIEMDLPVGHAHEAFSEDGRLAELELRERYVEILDELVPLAEQVGEPGRLAA